MEIIQPFKLKFIYLETDNFRSKKKKIIKELDKYPETDRGNFFSNKDSCKITEKLIDVFDDEFAKLDDYFDKDIYLETAWSVTYKKGNFHVPHNHGSTGYAGIIYLDLDVEHPKTTYLRPWQSEKDRTILYTPPVIEGDIMVIPKFLLHYSESNPIDLKKRIISFDFL